MAVRIDRRLENGSVHLKVAPVLELLLVSACGADARRFSGTWPAAAFDPSAVSCWAWPMGRSAGCRSTG